MGVMLKDPYSELPSTFGVDIEKHRLFIRR